MQPDGPPKALRTCKPKAERQALMDGKKKKLNEWKEGSCAFWMVHKGRYCSFPAKDGTKYCGNHLLMCEAGSEAIACPACTTLILVQDLALHLKKCPKQLLLLRQQAEPHYCPDINAGSDEDPDLASGTVPDNNKHTIDSNLATVNDGNSAPMNDSKSAPMNDSSSPVINYKMNTMGVSAAEIHTTTNSKSSSSKRIKHSAATSSCSNKPLSPFVRGTAAARLEAARQLGPVAFQQLLTRLEHVYAQECGSSEPPLNVIRPPCCEPLLRPQVNRQFSIKHALQQASLVGQLLVMGLIPGQGMQSMEGQKPGRLQQDLQRQPQQHQQRGQQLGQQGLQSQQQREQDQQGNESQQQGEQDQQDHEPQQQGEQDQQDHEPQQQRHQEHGAGQQQVRQHKQHQMGGQRLGHHNQRGGVCVIELGAGKAGLAAMVAEALQPAVSSTVVVDSQASFMYKSDRYIRQVCPSFSRYALDLKDCAVWRAPCLQPAPPQQQQGQNEKDQQDQQQQDAEQQHGSGHADRRPQQQGQQEKRQSPQQEGEQQEGPQEHQLQDSHFSLTFMLQQQHEQQRKREYFQGEGYKADRIQHSPMASPPLGWLAIGKHLCGAATDFALRGCLPVPIWAHNQSHKHAPGMIGGQDGGNERCREHTTSDGHKGGHDCVGVGGTSEPRQQLGDRNGGISDAEAAVLKRFRGLAIATCCHHRCGWKSYVGKQAFRSWGFSPFEFELVCWMTGWALCGHDAPPGHAPERDGKDSDAEDAGWVEKVDLSSKQGEAVKVGSDGQSAQQQAPQQVKAPRRNQASQGQQQHDTTQLGQQQVQQAQGDQMQLDQHYHLALEQQQQGMHSLVRRQYEQQNQGQLDQVQHKHQQQQQQTMFNSQNDPIEQEAEEGGREWDPARSIPRDLRIAIGAMCKQLIDRGRLFWLCERLGLPPPPSAAKTSAAPTHASDCKAMSEGCPWESSRSTSCHRTLGDSIALHSDASMNACQSGDSEPGWGEADLPHFRCRVVRYVEAEVSGENRVLLAHTGLS